MRQRLTNAVGRPAPRACTSLQGHGVRPAPAQCAARCPARRGPGAAQGGAGVSQSSIPAPVLHGPSAACGGASPGPRCCAPPSPQPPAQAPGCWRPPGTRCGGTRCAPGAPAADGGRRAPSSSTHIAAGARAVQQAAAHCAQVQVQRPPSCTWALRARNCCAQRRNSACGPSSISGGQPVPPAGKHTGGRAGGTCGAGGRGDSKRGGCRSAIARRQQRRAAPVHHHPQRWAAGRTRVGRHVALRDGRALLVAAQRRGSRRCGSWAGLGWAGQQARDAGCGLRAHRHPPCLHIPPTPELPSVPVPVHLALHKHALVPRQAALAVPAGRGGRGSSGCGRKQTPAS